MFVMKRRYCSCCQNCMS